MQRQTRRGAHLRLSKRTRNRYRVLNATNETCDTCALINRTSGSASELTLCETRAEGRSSSCWARNGYNDVSPTGFANSTRKQPRAAFRPMRQYGLESQALKCRHPKTLQFG